MAPTCSVTGVGWPGRVVAASGTGLGVNAGVSGEGGDGGVPAVGEQGGGVGAVLGGVGECGMAELVQGSCAAVMVVNSSAARR
jgi:hypothetical protein